MGHSRDLGRRLQADLNRRAAPREVLFTALPVDEEAAYVPIEREVDQRLARYSNGRRRGQTGPVRSKSGGFGGVFLACRSWEAYFRDLRAPNPSCFSLRECQELDPLHPARG